MTSIQHRPLATRNGRVIGSGQEDVGFERTVEQRAAAAEREARQRRIDRDKIVQAALDTLESEALDKVLRVGFASYIVGAANLDPERTRYNRAGYIRELFHEIRAELSPLVRGER